MAKTTVSEATKVTKAINEAHNGIELSFNGKPSNEVRQMLKDNGYHWHNARQIWYAKQGEASLLMADNLIKFYADAEVKSAPKAETKKSDKPKATTKATSKAKATPKAEPKKADTPKVQAKPKATLKKSEEPKAEVEKPMTKEQYIQMLKVTTQMYADGVFEFSKYYKVMNQLLDEMKALKTN